MHTDKDKDGKISISELTPDEAGLIQAAVNMLAELTDKKEHARFLRKLAMQIDKV
ncbi:MAG: hypothetical protein IJC16_00090 [Rikenellaceae bacterium]|nr:hypothetical protein [Rikenellaceae bacterium]